MDEDTVLTAQQIKALQRRNAELEEENLIWQIYNVSAKAKKEIKTTR